MGILWSQKSPVIAVGSGNPTFAGMHWNLECWELLTAGLIPGSAPPLVRCRHALVLRRLAGEHRLSHVGAGGGGRANWGDFRVLHRAVNQLPWPSPIRELKSNEVARRSAVGSLELRRLERT